ncbi:MAG: hypothetical protein OEV42_06525 [Deltaproteobacteria bacterium]|nr:hypothetical protein [Deltaproteobacteria bacterium]
MIKRSLIVLLGVTFLINFNGCRGSSVVLKKPATPIKRVAIASFTVSDWGGSVKSGSVGSNSVSNLINGTLGKLVSSTEKSLSKRFKVKSVKKFITNKTYQKLGSEKVLTVYTPVLRKKSMPVFTTVSRELKGGMIKPETAKALCKTLKVDAIVLIFSEWTVKQGGFIPITKAVSKNVFTMWDRDGNIIARKRIDKMGTKTLGAMGIKAVNEDTINEWGDTSRQSLEQIILSKEVSGLTR